MDGRKELTPPSQGPETEQTEQPGGVAMAACDASPPEKELPTYRAHKCVRALKIAGIGPVDPAWHAEDKGARELSFEEEGYAPKSMGGYWMEANDPEVGGYLVIYGGSFEAYVPAGMFAEHYSLACQEAEVTQGPGGATAAPESGVTAAPPPEALDTPDKIIRRLKSVRARATERLQGLDQAIGLLEESPIVAEQLVALTNMGVCWMH